MVVIWDMRPHLENKSESASNAGRNTSIVQPDTEGPFNAVPIQNFYDPHGGSGVVALEFTSDMKHLISLGADVEQTICIWNWTAQSNEPIHTHVVKAELQICLRVNPFDPFEFMSNGKKTVQFYQWDKESKKLSQNQPHLSSKDFKYTPSEYTYSTFIPHDNQSATGTTDGDIIIWSDRDLNNISLRLPKGQKAAIKFVRLHNTPITFVSNIDNQFIVTGGTDGHVKVFDMSFRSLFWCEKINAGPISTIAFSLESSKLFDDISVPELVVATTRSTVSLIHHQEGSVALSPFKPNPVSEFATTVSPSSPNTDSLASNVIAAKNAGAVVNPTVTVLLSGQHGTIQGLDIHPTNKIIGVGGETGILQLWNYDTKQIVGQIKFEELPSAITQAVQNIRNSTKASPSKDSQNEDESEKPKDVLLMGQTTGKFKPALVPMKITCVAFSSSGKTVAVGFQSGIIRLLNAQTLEDLPQSHLLKSDAFGHQVSRFAIVKITFSEDGEYLAAADSDHVVLLLKKESVRVKVGSAGGHDKHEDPNLFGSEQDPDFALTFSDSRGDEHIKFRNRIEWVFIGRRKTHFKDVISLVFLPKVEEESADIKMLSVSNDRHVATYNISHSSLGGGIVVENIRRIEQIYRPEAATLITKHHDVHPEQFILTFNSGYKMKQFTTGNQMCRKTSLAPTFGGHINNLVVVPNTDSKYVVFSTSNQVSIVLSSFNAIGTNFIALGCWND